MRFKFLCQLLFLALTMQIARAQGTVPTFEHSVGHRSYTLVGSDPAKGATTTIPTVLVPITLSFDAKKLDGKPYQMGAGPDVESVLRSPVFSRFAFTSGGTTQYADAMLRTTFPAASEWHTLLAKPEVKPVTITIPVGYGYVLTSRKDGSSFAVVDVNYLQKALFQQVPKQDGKLIIAMTHNTTYYAVNDATVCCSWGAHGVDSSTGNSFVLASYLKHAPGIVEDRDVQPLTQQLAEFINDPLHDPLLDPALQNRGVHFPGNAFPRWMRPATMRPGDQGRCGGTGVASTYFQLEPTDTNRKNNFPASKAYLVQSDDATYHLQNVALLPWYTGNGDGLGSTYSFPDAKALNEPARPCSARGRQTDASAGMPTAAALPLTGAPNGHKLIGYWTGHGAAGAPFPLHEISPQWDVIIVAFASPVKNAPEGTLRFQLPAGLDAAQFKADIALLRKQGKKVMISLGGGGEYFTLAHASSIPNFTSSVSSIVSEYGFDGIDIDFESPSLTIAAGDTDFTHPTTPSIVNLIAGLRQLHDHFGPGFMISLVPEGTQIPSGYPSYGGQFGSYLPITYAIRDILSFIDVQDYNTPPLEGLDGEIYQAGSVDYHAAMTELVLHGFNVGGDPKQFFPPVPADKVAVGFLTGDATPAVVSHAMDYIITGKAPAGASYKLLKPGGYPGMIGAMFWTIDDDRLANYKFSNVIGPQLHSYPTNR
ncbi:glycosyl hydrolase family 18 protein [Acidipila rosea]|uniref:chitinase n=1 Tax=Acidipila rosea TaxID=768535 RepID=A0A4R1L646_9BACT|nr:glycosyl hydrolase family 18 protein [Acidipila rosea]TCK73615.1 chitinase [Acidipila rosea]